MPDIFESPRHDGKSETAEKMEEKNTPAEAEKNGGLINLTPGTDVHKLPGHTHNRFSGFCLYPEGVSFSGSDPEEKIILLLRKHPITNFPWLVISFFLIIAPSFFSLLPFFESLPRGFPIIITLVWYLVTAAYILENFLGWFFNINLVTTERVVDIDFVHLLYREVSETQLEKIQEPTFDLGGLAESFFNYGDVWLQTAAEVSRIEFRSVPQPERVVKIIRDLENQVVNKLGRGGNS